MLPTATVEAEFEELLMVEHNADGTHDLADMNAIEVFNVIAYGAIGDGVSDDTAAIQNALKAAEAVGGTVYFPAGIYPTASTLTVKADHVKLLGDGPASIILGVTDGMNAIEITDYAHTTVDSVRVSNLKIIVPPDGIGIYTRRTSNLLLDDVKVDGDGVGDYCVYLDQNGPARLDPGNIRTVIRDCRFSNIANDPNNAALYIGERAHAFSVEDSTIFGNGSNTVDIWLAGTTTKGRLAGLDLEFGNKGIYWDSTGNIYALTIENCTFESHIESEIDLASDSKTIYYLTIANCAFQNGGLTDAIIELNKAQGVFLANNFYGSSCAHPFKVKMTGRSVFVTNIGTSSTIMDPNGNWMSMAPDAEGMVLNDSGGANFMEIDADMISWRERGGTEWRLRYDQGRDAMKWIRFRDAEGRVVNETMMYVTDTNRVGLMDPSPQALLDVGGGIADHIDGTGDLLVKDDLEVDGDTYIEGKMALRSMTITEVDAGNPVDVNSISMLKIDTGDGDVTIGGLANGIDGQILYVVVVDAANNTTLKHNASGSAQHLFLSSGEDEVLENSYGGWTLICNGTHWFEIDD